MFVGAMCAFGVFLLAYQFGAFDNWLGNVAGLAAIVVAFFPTAPDLAATGWVYGTVIVVCLVLAPAKFLVEVNRSELPVWFGGIPLFWLESAAIVAFGVSWFTTGTDLFSRNDVTAAAEPRAEEPSTA